jgi:hypothetical protein
MVLGPYEPIVRAMVSFGRKRTLKKANVRMFIARKC